MSETEDRSHFALWCILASPLIAGNDLRSMSATTQGILTNKGAISVNQDKLGVRAKALALRFLHAFAVSLTREGTTPADPGDRVREDERHPGLVEGYGGRIDGATAAEPRRQGAEGHHCPFRAVRDARQHQPSRDPRGLVRKKAFPALSSSDLEGQLGRRSRTRGLLRRSGRAAVPQRTSRELFCAHGS